MGELGKLEEITKLRKKLENARHSYESLLRCTKDKNISIMTQVGLKQRMLL